jgi:hypothetical protein
MRGGWALVIPVERLYAMSESPMSADMIGSEYVRLALALDQHLPGYVDAYFGPPEWQAQAKTAGPRPLSELAQQASTLAEAVARDDTLTDQRRDFLTRHVVAMQTSLRLLHGDRMALVDEVEAVYDVRPTWIDEAHFEETHRLINDMLPPGDNLLARITLRKQALEIGVEPVKQLLPLIRQHLQQLSRGHFPLPEEESLEFTFVQNQPWMAYHWYLGRGQSRIEINTDIPLHVHTLADIVAHEAYPGHHTEFTIKENLLVRQAGYLEHSVALLNAPSSVVSEGIATCALTTVLPDEAWVAWHDEEIFPRAGLNHLSAQREQMLDQALARLKGVNGNAAFLLHEQGASAETVRRYLQHYGLLTEQEAEQRIAFISRPLDRAYIFTYYWGQTMLEALFDLKPARTAWFTRLLTEAVTPTQIRQWMQD